MSIFNSYTLHGSSLPSASDGFSHYTYDYTSQGYTYFIEEHKLNYANSSGNYNRVHGYAKFAYKATRQSASSISLDLVYQSRGSNNSYNWCSYRAGYTSIKFNDTEVPFTSAAPNLGVTSQSRYGVPLSVYRNYGGVVNTLALGGSMSEAATQIYKSARGVYNFTITDLTAASTSLTVQFASFYSETDLIGGEGSSIRELGDIVSTIDIPSWCTLTYNLNGGVGSVSSVSNGGGTQIAVTSTQPTKEGYTFLGWATSQSATAAQYQGGALYTLPNTTSTTLYAVWKKNIAQTNVLVGQTWEQADTYVNVNGDWKEVTNIYVNVNGVWKETS